MGFLYSIIGFLIAIAVLVAVHEFGHFWVARKLGVKVLRFSVGFGKPLWKKVAGPDQTEYVIAVIPLGGYVKMLGEGGDEPIDPAEKHRAFDNQPIWKRSLIVAAGPGINFLFAIVLFMLLGMISEQRVVPVFGAPVAQSAVANAGVVEGDTLLEIDGKPVKHILERDLYIFNKVLKQQAIELLIKDDVGQTRLVSVKTDGIPIYNINPSTVMRQLGLIHIAPPSSGLISVVSDGSPASKAGLKKGDHIVSIDGVVINNWFDLRDIVMPSAGKQLSLLVDRSGERFRVNVTPKSIIVGDEEVGQLGVGGTFLPYQEDQLISFSRSPIQAFFYGVDRTWQMSTLTLRMLGKMITGQVSPKNVSGPVTIAEVAGQAIQINWQSYVYVLAVISISLGVMNLLPIPMLDGGHLLTYAVELVAGRRISEKFFAAGQRVGILLLLCLMSLAFYNDIFRLLN